MESNSYTLNDVQKAVSILENHKQTRDFQALEEILPLVLTVLKSQVRESHLHQGDNKFYAPIWVDNLLHRLSTNAQPLTDKEYQTFRTKVANLSINDYKIVNNDLIGYIPVSTSIEGITDVILALKHYFGFI